MELLPVHEALMTLLGFQVRFADQVHAQQKNTDLIRLGHDSLVHFTGVDLGYEPDLWHEHLLATKVSGYQGYLNIINRVMREPIWHRVVASYHAPSFNPLWRTSDVVDLAQAIVHDRAYDRLPILADALIDAGCDDEIILNHCRRGKPEQVESWVIYMVLEENKGDG